MMDHAAIPPADDPRNRKKILVIGLAVVFGMAVLAVLVGSELRARSWERKWRDLRTEWEAKGEDFGIKAHLPPPAPDEENVFMHPWIRRLATDKALQERIEEMHKFSKPAIGKWLSSGDSAEALVGELNADPDLARQVRKYFEDCAPELDAFSEAMARPGYAYPPDMEISIGARAPWSYWIELGEVLRCRAILAIAEKNAEQFVDDMTTLVHFSNHLRHDAFCMGVSISNNIDAVVCQLIGEGLDSGILGRGDRNRLIRALEAERPTIAAAITRPLRCGRGRYLQFIDKLQNDAEKSGSRAINISGVGKAKGNAPKWLVRRATWWRMFFARNRLALCEDLQHCLLSPDGEVLETIRLEDLPRFLEAGRKRFADEDSAAVETIAAMFPPPVSRLAKLMEKTGKMRKEILDRLRDFSR
jgi:hypothetical protein